MMLTLIQKTHFQSQIAHPEGYQHPVAKRVIFTLHEIKFADLCSQACHVANVNLAHTCQQTPRLSTEGGRGVALANLETAMKVPVDYKHRS
jgi:hypothetical protein